MKNILSQTKPNVLDAKTAGQLLRDKRKTLGLTLVEVAARTTVPSHSYLAGLEVGRIAIGRSKHLGSLAEVLGLSDQEIASIVGRIPTEGQIDLTNAISLARKKQNEGQEPALDQRDPRNARHLNIATVVAGNWDGRAIGAYTLDDDPHEVLVVDPAQNFLEAGRHFLVLNQEGHAIVRTVCVLEGKHLKLLCGHAVMKKGKFKVMGRILFEARAL